MSGPYQLHWLREVGLSGHVLEAGTGVGGTWYSNRYPGGAIRFRKLLLPVLLLERPAGRAGLVRECGYLGNPLGEGDLLSEVNPWMAGVNTNAEGKQVRIVNCYSSGAPAYRARCNEVAAHGYRKLALA